MFDVGTDEKKSQRDFLKIGRRPIKIASQFLF